MISGNNIRDKVEWPLLHQRIPFTR